MASLREAVQDPGEVLRDDHEAVQLLRGQEGESRQDHYS